MQLTKEQTIQEHRKMWNWIADQYKNKTEIFNECGCIQELKHKYIDLYVHDDVRCDCFCCDYSYNQNLWCEGCPIDWNSTCDDSMCMYKNNNDKRHLYGEIQWRWFGDMSDYERFKFARIARRIANLPERK